MSNSSEKDVNECLLTDQEKACIFCATRKEESSSPLPKWPNIESITTKNDSIPNTGADKPLLDNLKDQLNEDHENYSLNSMAAYVNNVFYSYGSGKKAVNALNGITINVPEGNIYSILGPSGCGKTTLIHCLVGSLKPCKGSVKVFGHRPGSFLSIVPGPGVGYMPQEIGLFAEFTIEETLTFYGVLYRLPKDVIKQSIKFLLSFLDLPDKTRIVANLSGGQKRRVSLAAALVHKPPLLVLDEPTVGIDPVLRHSIWKHLIELSKEGITVVITTHYIEEARSANIVAFMRQGMLLQEGNPEKIMKSFNLTNLEDVFLHLCSKESTELNNGLSNGVQINGRVKSSDEISLKEIKVNKIKTGIELKPNGVIKSNDKQNKFKSNQISIIQKRNHIADHFARTSALFWKNATRMFRNLPVLIFTLLVPSIQGILFFFCIGRDPYNLSVAVFNAENTPKFSLDYLQSINNYTIIQKPVKSLEEGIKSVENGKNRGLIAIGSNFSEALIQRSIEGYFVEEKYIEMSKINLYLDMTTQFAANKIIQSVHEAYQAFAKDILRANEMSESIADPPIHIHTPVLGSKNPPVTEFMAPGFILSLLFLSSIAPTALTLVLERKDGLLERSLVSGVHPYEYIISHVLTQIFVVIIQASLLMILSFVIFDIPCRGSILWVALLVVMQGICGMTYGLFISSFCKEENSAFILCMGSMFPQFLMSGTVWPIETMPKLMVIISSVFPQGISIDAVRHILFRGWGPQHFEVALGYIITGSWTLVFLIGAGIIFGIKRSN